MLVVRLHYLGLNRALLSRLVSLVKEVIAEEMTCGDAPITSAQVRVLVSGDQGVDEDARFNAHMGVKVIATPNCRLNWPDRCANIRQRLGTMFPELVLEFFFELCERAIWEETSKPAQ